jgi:glycerophosphoryl diester phosphodiesterase
VVAQTATLAALLALAAGLQAQNSLPDSQDPADMKTFVNIAHRGAAGYLPEHTLEGVAMAHAMGADYIEQDVVMTRDGRLVVLHDLYLDRVTDVAERFPNRARDDGLHYAFDFDLAEIRTLRVHERTDADGTPAFPGRFPVGKALFRIPTFDEEIALIQGLNRATGRSTGIYVEPKSPAWHREQGIDLTRAVIEALARHGYTAREHRAFLQSFDAASLRRARQELGSDLRLVQLIGENEWKESDTDFDELRTPDGLKRVAEYANGIGPWLPQVVDINENDPLDISQLTQLAKSMGLFVHAYTLRADQLPAHIDGLDRAMRILLAAGLDGVFTDHPDQVHRYLQEQQP